MIEIKKCSKSFGSVKAVDKVSLEIGEREVFGLVGSNGAGKSTLLRMAAGILKPDEGEIEIDGESIYDNEKAKACIFYIPDDSYFPADYTPRDIADFYRCYYPKFDVQRFSKFLRQFHMDDKKRISTFSKGMRKQLLVLLGVSAGTKYLLCDETFDGLDPVMRQGVKSLFASEIMGREFTPVIASHNLRELEDMKFHIHKIQCVLKDKDQERQLQKEMDVLKTEHQGSLLLLTVRGTREQIMEKIQGKNPLFCEILPLTLEEIFISETEVAGYEIKNLFF